MEKYIVLGSLVVGWLVFTLWTVKKLWRSSDDQAEALFWAKVKIATVFVTVTSSLCIPQVLQLPPLSYWQQVGLWLFALFAGMLWAIYVGARLFHRIVG